MGPLWRDLIKTVWPIDPPWSAIREWISADDTDPQTVFTENIVVREGRAWREILYLMAKMKMALLMTGPGVPASCVEADEAPTRSRSAP